MRGDGIVQGEQRNGRHRDILIAVRSATGRPEAQPAPCRHRRHRGASAGAPGATGRARAGGKTEVAESGTDRRTPDSGERSRDRMRCNKSDHSRIRPFTDSAVCGLDRCEFRRRTVPNSHLRRPGAFRRAARPAASRPDRAPAARGAFSAVQRAPSPAALLRRTGARPGPRIRTPAFLSIPF